MFNNIRFRKYPNMYSAYNSTIDSQTMERSTITVSYILGIYIYIYIYIYIHIYIYIYICSYSYNIQPTINIIKLVVNLLYYVYVYLKNHTILFNKIYLAILSSSLCLHTSWYKYNIVILYHSNYIFTIWQSFILYLLIILY